jgi:LuxR family maltose regulon positive regulatory protein
MAARLFITRNTVKSHMSHVYRKLGVTSRTDAVEAARRLGLL